MFKKNFDKFDFRGFVDFIFELVDSYRMDQIIFRPEHKELFSSYQLTHIAPSRKVNHPGGFVWAWKKKLDLVKRVSFDLFNKNGKRKIAMTIDLDENFISLDKEEGISSIEVEDILKRNIEIESSSKAFQEEKEGKFPGVYLAARKIINLGEISSKGPGYRTEVITEDYKGTGTIKSEDTELPIERWYQKWWVKILITIATGLIVLLLAYYVFGIK